MVKPEWGMKRKCLKCGAFFYDMRQQEFSCPKCQEAYSVDSYAEAKNKSLLKLAKKAAPRLDDEDLDEEALLRMTEDVPLGEDEIGDDDEMEILDDEEDLTENENLNGLMETYEDEKSE